MHRPNKITADEAEAYITPKYVTIGVSHPGGTVDIRLTRKQWAAIAEAVQQAIVTEPG